MSEVYAACVDQLLINLARHFQFIKDGAPIPGSWDYTVRKLAEMDAVTRESEQIILSMLGDADESLRGLLEEAIRNGLKDSEPALKKAAENGLTNGVDVPNIAPRQMQAFQYYYEQSADKLNLVNTVMLESTEQAYAATVADISAKIGRTQGILNTATGEIITGTASFNRVQRDAVRRMVDNGITGYIDHGGHHWSPEAYVAMDMRTTMTNTAREAVWEQSDSVGCELYQVSWHDGARPLCYPWQGKVISRNGWTGTVEDDEGNKVQVHSESEIESFRYGGGLFGVNCGHYPIPFFPGFSRMRPPQQNEEENAKEYAESQQQRALERKVRDEKRELEVMKAQGATKEEIDAQKLRVRNANANLTEFCDKTGRARQPGRTSAPINATFPDGYQQTRYGAKNAPQTPTPAPATPAPQNVPLSMQQVDFTPAKTIEEAEAYAMEHFGNKYSSMSYKGIDLEFANTCNRVLTEVYEKVDIPQYTKWDTMKGVQPMNMRTSMFRGSTAEAAYHWGGDGTLFINPTYYKSGKAFAAHKAQIDELTKTVLEGGQGLLDSGKYERQRTYIETLLRTGRQCVSQSHDFFEASIVHESGHLLEDKVFRKIADEFFGKDGSLSMSESRLKYGINISGYAVADNHEYIAESFAAWWYGETSILDPNIIRMFEKVLK